MAARDKALRQHTEARDALFRAYLSAFDQADGDDVLAITALLQQAAEVERRRVIRLRRFE